MSTTADTTTRAEFAVTGMSCGHCEGAITREVSGIPGVTDVEVSAQTGRLSVTAQGPVDTAAVLTAVDEAGYSAATA
ncbi:MULTISPECIES: heavy-metal-associated domain-containing protein [Leucobacter]|uniref:Heavy-metal-associated domain-containing protein n=1 Tax=Leucobacter iarius TaxID=333963 RepID=A0ABN2L7Z4_9MICO|nr:heavy metal-associated domain-containing protein [Leucobacter sp. Ag1]KKI21237.1 heavy metal transporter [Leucobacter sp. Ag1]